MQIRNNGHCYHFENGLQNNAASGASIIVLGLYPTRDIGLVANEVKKLSNKFVGGKKAVWGE